MVSLLEKTIMQFMAGKYLERHEFNSFLNESDRLPRYGKEKNFLSLGTLKEGDLG